METMGASVAGIMRATGKRFAPRRTSTCYIGMSNGHRNPIKRTSGGLYYLLVMGTSGLAGTPARRTGRAIRDGYWRALRTSVVHGSGVKRVTDLAT